MMQDIIIDIEPDGKIKIEAQGFEGPECKQLTAEIEKALGEVTTVKEKPEYRRGRMVTRTAGR